MFLLRLVDKSMVVAERIELGTRYRLLDTIRDYALDRLEEAGEAGAARTRHARWYRGLAESADPAAGATPVAWLDQELANIRTALTWCLGAGAAPDLALAIAAPLWWYWWVAGASDEGHAWLRRCLAAADPAPSPARALGLRAAAALVRSCGDNHEALRLGEDCLAAYRALADDLGVAAALNGLCITASHMGDYETALRHAAASLERARAAGSRHGEATSLTNLGTVLRCLGRLREAEEADRDALAGATELGNRHLAASALNNLGLVAHRSGDLAGARRRALESLAAYHGIDLGEGELDAPVTIAAVEVAEGRPDRALLLLSVVDRERRRLRVAAPSRDEADEFARARAAAGAAVDEQRRTAVLGEARRTGLDAVVAELLSGGGQ